MEQTRKKLLAIFLSEVVGCLLLVVLGEAELLSPTEMAADKVVEYYAVGAMELLTICCIPLALRLFKFSSVSRQLAESPETALLKWGVVRMGMLSLPMTANTLLYYLFMNVAFGYMAIILLLCLFFVYPSAARCQQETHRAE